MKLPLVLITLLSLTACSADQVTLTLGAAVDALAAVAVVAAPQDLPFINLASSCLNNATMELDTMDTNLQKVTVIIADCANVEAGATGLSPLGVALANAISTFLIEIKSLETPAKSTVKLYRMNTTKLQTIKTKLARIPRR